MSSPESSTVSAVWQSSAAPSFASLVAQLQQFGGNKATLTYDEIRCLVNGIDQLTVAIKQPRFPTHESAEAHHAASLRYVVRASNEIEKLWCTNQEAKALGVITGLHIWAEEARKALMLNGVSPVSAPKNDTPGNPPGASVEAKP